LATGSGLLAAKLVHRQLTGETVDWQTEYEDLMRKGVDVFRSFVLGWYNGDIQTIFFADTIESNIKEQVCSILAGYVWDENNPLVKKHKTIVPALAQVIRMNQLA
jgi:hypothetical protein